MLTYKPSGVIPKRWRRRFPHRLGLDSLTPRTKVDSRGNDMAEVLLFHHAQGQTAGFLAFADALRDAGHIVHTPDLYDGTTFPTLDEGVSHAKEIGFDAIGERGRRAADGLPNELVYAGFSLGVMPAQELAQTRVRAKGALFFSAAFPASEFGASWPAGVPLQIHMMEGDEWAMEDLPAARELTESTPGAELFLYPGNGHLFADSSLADYDEGAATLLVQRVLAFLRNIE
jgi:dienelactone hydrolase